MNSEAQANINKQSPQEILSKEEELTSERAKRLLEAGVHFGQQVSKRSPKMDKFVYGTAGNGLQVIDLNITWQKLRQAGSLIKKLVSNDKNILFVGTGKRVVSRVLSEYSEKYKLHHITNRWLGGTLTNPIVMRNRINYLRELEAMEKSGLMDSVSAKEKSTLNKKYRKLKKNLGGLKEVKGGIQCIVLIDPMLEANATLEAIKKKGNLSIIAIVDTDCSFPLENFDVVVPCNISSLRSLREVFEVLIEYYQAGQKASSVRKSQISSNNPRRSPRGFKKPASITRNTTERNSSGTPQQSSKE